MNKILLASALPLLALPQAPAQAAVVVDTVGFAYSQTFDSLTTSTTASAWVNDSTLPGWSLFTSTLAAAPTLLGGNGNANTGSFYSYGGAGSSDRALGGTASGGTYFVSPATGTVAGYIAVAFSNQTGEALDGFTLAFNGEQWRNGGNTSAQPMVLEYGIGASFGTVAAWTASAALSWNSPVTGATAAAVDGNVAGLVPGLWASVGGLGWAAGDTLWVRWTERNDAGNDHGMAIDDLSLTVSAVPEPGALALMLAGLAAVGFVARRRG